MAARAPQLAAVLLWAFFSCGRSAQADTPEATRPSGENRPYLVTIRGAAGLGVGQMGLAGRAALSGEGWFSDHFGAGAFWGDSGQSAGPFGAAEALQFVGASVAARTAPRGNYALIEVGAGYAWGQDQGGGLLDRPSPTNQAGVLWSASGAWLFHFDAFETGPVLAMDMVTTSGAFTLTANWSLGLALR
jgi:hypothetical protein